MAKRPRRTSAAPADFDPALLDQLMAGVTQPEQLEGVFRTLKKALVERALGAELTAHLGYAPGDPKPATQPTHRNGTTPKTVITDDGALDLAIPRDRAERLARLTPEEAEYDYHARYSTPEAYPTPTLFFHSTYQQDVAHRAETAQRLAQTASAAGMLSAGYIEVSAHSNAYINSFGYTRYFQHTWAQYSVTVRDPKGTGSGWAGVDWPDWNKIDGAKLSAIALDKYLRSRNPVALEPGRYTTILEPRAVGDLVKQMVQDADSFARFTWNSPHANEGSIDFPFTKEVAIDGDPNRPGFARFGERVIDERLSLRADPMDPELGFPPFRPMGSVLHPFSSERGLLATRFDRMEWLYLKSVSCSGYTRDGLWLIENGKISKVVKNFRFVESVIRVLNAVEQVGKPQRVFNPPSTLWPWNVPQPIIVPALKVRDFSLTALSDTV